MNLFSWTNFISWLKTGKISAWKANDSELTTATRLEGSGRVGSFQEQSPDGTEYKGIQVTLPIPNPPK